MVLLWLKRKRAKSELLALDRKHLEARAQRYLNKYLDADSGRKEHYRKAIALAAKKCRDEAGVGDYWSSADQRTPNEDARAAIDASQIAVKEVGEKSLEEAQADLTDPTGTFIADTYAAIAVAYRFAAGIYEENPQMKRLGNAAFMLITVSEGPV